MTALALARPASVRAVPWHRLAWVVWRRYRTTLAVSVSVLALLGIYLLVDGNRMRSAYAAYQACTPATSAHCEFAWNNFREHYGQNGFIAMILLFLPGIVGAFAGAPVLARELETGTFRYTWTQGVGRMRWAFAVFLPGAVGVAVLLGAFGVLVSWHNQPLFDTANMPRLRATSFPITGLAAGGWALAGFALGVAAGLLWRRVLAALATAFAAWFGLAFLTATVLRPNYLSQLTTTSQELSKGDLSTGQWWTKGGVRVSDAQIDKALQAIGVSTNGGGVHVQPGAGQAGPGTNVDPVQYLLQHSYQQVTSYQPGSRYWPFQWIEFGWLVAFSVLLLAASLWLLRRRPA
jgi:hypothetical protein